MYLCKELLDACVGGVGKHHACELNQDNFNSLLNHLS